MRISYTLIFILFIISSYKSFSQDPPYWGTNFINSEIITEESPSAFSSISYKGLGIRTVFDKRTARFEAINAFLFDVEYDDGLTTEAIVNTEFETVDNALIEAEKYAYAIGQLPNCLRLDVDGIWIHKGVQLFGGGNRSILIHTGQSEIYERDGILEETLVHEAAHTSLDAYYAQIGTWLDAQNKDGNFISTYAKDNPTREDIAESFLTWLMVRFKEDIISSEDYDIITSTIPNRLLFFDYLYIDLYPFVIETSDNNLDLEFDISLYPNPVNNALNIKSSQPFKKGIIEILSIEAKSISKTNFENGNNFRINFNYPPGIYLIRIQDEDKVFIEKVVKN